jgi:hypothetical protein
MDLQSVRDLKAAIRTELAGPLRADAMRAPPVPEGMVGRGLPRMGESARADGRDVVGATVAVGVAISGRRDYMLAIRLQRTADKDHPKVQQMVQLARGEVDLRYTGRVVKEQAPRWHQGLLRPLRIGGSVGHHKISAGTIGGFVALRDGATAILSNNHVLANENLAAVGDAVYQPGPADGGTAAEQVARLSRFIRLRRHGNAVDAAAAAVIDGIAVDHRRIRGIGRLAGLGGMPDVGAEVRKSGRTTGTRRGVVSAIELDNLVVAYDIGDLSFDGQMEIEGTGRNGFSDGGDSGSLIVDGDRLAVGLLFAGSSQGGSNGRGLTFANPIEPVLQELGATLMH